MQNFKEKLNAIISLCDGKQTKAAQILQIQSSYISQLVNGKRTPSARLEAVVESKLAELRGKQARGMAQQEPPNATIAGPTKGTKLVPVVSFARAGSLDLARDYEDLASQIDTTVETTSKDANAFAVEIEGDSMAPEYHPRDIVILDPGREPAGGEACLVRLNDGRVFFKYIQRTAGGLRLWSENSLDYPPIDIESKDVRFVYPASDVKRRPRIRDLRGLSSGFKNSGSA